jgi:hypothetical protein
MYDNELLFSDSYFSLLHCRNIYKILTNILQIIQHNTQPKKHIFILRELNFMY